MFLYDFFDQLENIENTDTENGRFYTTPSGERYWSVTTVLGRAMDMTGIEQWRDRIGHAEAAKVLRQAGVRGTAIHDLAEKYLLSVPNYDRKAMPFNKMSFKPIRVQLDKHLGTIHAIEAPLYSDKLKIAGRVDLIGTWDGKLAIIDFKTSRWPKPKEYFEKYFMQEALYAFMLFERLRPSKLHLYEKVKLVTIMTVDHENEAIVHVEDAATWGPKAVNAVLRNTRPVLV